MARQCTNSTSFAAFSDSSSEDAGDYVPEAFPLAAQTGNHLWGRLWWRWDVRTGKRLSSIRWLISRIAQALWSEFLWHPSVREILKELGSLEWRIRRICQASISVRYGCLQGNRVGRLANARTRACIRDTQEIGTIRPRATLLDRQLFVEGWQRGAEWALCEIRNSRPDSLHIDLEASANPDGGKSMPPSEVPQPTKRDRLNPLP